MENSPAPKQDREHQYLASKTALMHKLYLELALRSRLTLLLVPLGLRLSIFAT